MKNFFHKNFSIYLIISIININEYLLSLLETGALQFQNFIYHDRLKLYSKQNRTQKCSISDGPNCLFLNNYQCKTDINENWQNIMNQTRNNNITYKKLSSIIRNKNKKYIQKYSSENDSSQTPPSITLKLGLTFESYDEMTMNNDIYASSIKYVKYYVDVIPIEIYGKLRLRYNKDSLKVKKGSDYPSGTYAIVETNNVSIKLGGKSFICTHFFIRARNIDLKTSANVIGYLDGKEMYSTEKALSSFEDKAWVKVSLPNKKIDVLTIPKGFEYDSFSFVIETFNQYNVNVHFYRDPTKRYEELVTDLDIY